MDTQGPGKSPRLRPALTAALATLLLLALTGSSGAVSPTDWQGDWDTFWPDGGARLTLQVQGDQVTGSYSPGEGLVEGTVHDDALAGQWRDRSGAGTFRISLSRDGATFFGRFGSGLWWTARKAGTDGALPPFVADRSSPRAVLRSFLIAANSVRLEHLDYVQPALDCLSQEPAADRQPGPQNRDRSLLFFSTLDLVTLRLADIPERVPTETLTVTLGQDGSAETMDLTFLLQEGVWRMVVPGEAELLETRRRFLAARGKTAADPLGHLSLANPRATLRTFIQGYKDWEMGGAEQVRATLDLTGANPALANTEFPILATYLKETLDRVGLVIYQEIPDDPGRQAAHVHFRHPRGNIVLAPTATDGGVVWRFTPQTLAGIRTLYEALEDEPLASSLLPRQARARYFQINQWVRQQAPALTGSHLGGLKDWQWLAVALTVLLAVATAWIFDAGSRAIVRARLARRNVTLDGKLHRRLFAPLAVTLGVGVGYGGAITIGLPLDLLPLLHTAVIFIVALGLAWTAFTTAGIVQDYLQRRAARTVSYYDELLVSVVGGLTKIAIGIMGALLLGRELGVPLGGLLAGFGAGGLAFAIAAKDTLANIIGSGVLLADRPFKRGDLVAVAGHQGYIEKMGLRSTQMRTQDDSVVSIPNNLLVNEFIDNLGRRRLRRLVGRVGVTYDTPGDLLQAFAAGLLQTMRDQPSVSPDKMSAGVYEFGESSIDFEFVCYLDAPTGQHERQERHRLFVAVTRLAEELGVTFAFPTRTIRWAEREEKEGCDPSTPAAGV